MGIRNGVLQNAKPLTNEQMRLLRNRVNETGEHAICISPLPNKKLTIICPRASLLTSDLFMLAWERYEIISGTSSYAISIQLPYFLTVL